jgi:chitin-binding protein
MSISLSKKSMLAIFAAIAAVIVLATTFVVNSVSAHGSIVDPATRNYGCWARWGSDFQNPIMATQDPMCWQAWQANPNAMWNWNGLFREGLAGNHQGNIPDGQLCSGGHAEGGRYNAMDAVGDWRAASISNNFRVKLYDQASHGADYIMVFVTRQGFNPITQPLRWADLELVGQIGNTPASQWTPESAGGVSIQVAGSAPGRTGRHMIYTIWQASHLDQSYYFCSDVQFGGSTPPTGSPTPTPTSTPSPSPSPTSSPLPPVGNCTATYRVTNSWSGGFQAEVTVTAGAAATHSWIVHWNYDAGQTITNLWNGDLLAPGPHAMVGNAAWNGALPARGTTTFGFLGTWNGTNPAPALTCTAT